MIQRIQSLFLLGATICLGVACFMPIGTFYTADISYIYTSWVLKPDIVDGIGIRETYYIGLLQVILAVMSFVAIFFYKNRPLQSKICTAAIIISFIMLVLMLWIYPGRIFPQILQIQGEPKYTFGAYISLAPVALLYLANKFIMRDEKKVRAADRLR